MTLSSSDALAVTRRVDARVEMLHGARPLKHGARVRVHQGTAEGLGRVAMCAVSPAGGREWTLAAPGESAVAIGGGGHAYVRIRLEQPMALTRGDRLILRTYSPPATIGGAVVLDPLPPTVGLRRPAMLERFKAIDGGLAPAASTPEALRVWLREAGERGLTAQDVVARGGLGPEASRAALAALVDTGQAIPVATHVFESDVARALESRVVGALEAFHRTQPREAGIPKEELRARAAPRAAQGLVEHVLQSMASRGVIAASDRVALSTHRLASSPEDDRDAARVESVIRDAGLTPPDLAGIAAASRERSHLTSTSSRTNARLHVGHGDARVLSDQMQANDVPVMKVGASQVAVRGKLKMIHSAKPTTGKWLNGLGPPCKRRDWHQDDGWHYAINGGLSQHPSCFGLNHPASTALPREDHVFDCVVSRR